MEKLNFDSVLDEGKFKQNPTTVREAFNANPKIIFELIKKYHYNFDDEVLAAAHITRTSHSHRVENVIVDKDPVKPSNKKYKKDKKSMDEILDEICNPDINDNFDNDAPAKKSELDPDNIVMPEYPEI